MEVMVMRMMIAGGEMMTEAEKDEVMANSAFKDVRNRRHTIKTRTKEVLPLDHDPVKAQSAEEFRQRLDVVKADPDYARMKAEHQRMYEGKHDATKPKPKARTRTESATPAVKR
jgi:G3E family GTPase